jgi:conjugal transfer pilus assembly protein TraD
VKQTNLEKLFEINKAGSIRSDKQLYIGDVVRLPIKNMKIEKYYLSPKERASHIGCFGTTGIGKSKFIGHLCYQDILTGLSTVIIDPKGDENLLSTIIMAAAEAGRLEELMFISPIYPDSSIKINPLSYYYMPDELVHHVVSGIQSREEFFENIATNVTTVIITGLIAQALARGEEPRISLLDVKNKITYPALKDFAVSLRNLKNHPDKKVRDLVDDALSSVSHIMQYPEDFFHKVSASLGTVLTQLTSSTTGQIIGKSYENEFIKRLEEGKRVILICNTGSLLARKTAYVIARVIISMILSAVGRVLASGRVFDPPLSIYMDEGHNILFPGIEELFSKGRSANVYLQFFTQSLANIEEAVGEKTTQSIMDNINTWIFMKVNHEVTAKYIEDSTPLKNYYEKVINVAGGNLGISMREQQQRLILKEDVMQLRERSFYLRSNGVVFSGKVPFIGDPYIKLKFPDVTFKKGVVGDGQRGTSNSDSEREREVASGFSQDLQP